MIRSPFLSIKPHEVSIFLGRGFILSEFVRIALNRNSLERNMDRTNHATDEFDLINLQKLKPSRIVTDGDLDGIASAAILLRAFPMLK